MNCEAINIWCFQTPGFGVICYIAMDNEYRFLDKSCQVTVLSHFSCLEMCARRDSHSPPAQRSPASPDSTLPFTLAVLVPAPQLGWRPREPPPPAPPQTQLLHHSSRNWQSGDVPPETPEMEGAETEQCTVTPEKLLLPPACTTHRQSPSLVPPLRASAQTSRQHGLHLTCSPGSARQSP